MSINWTSETEFDVGRASFTIDMGWAGKRAASNEDRFTIVKTTTYLDEYEKIADIRDIDTMLEVGFFEGGSTVFFHEFLQPSKLVALDRRRDPIPPLTTFALTHAQDSLHVEYDMDQADLERLSALCHEHFPTGIDLIVDDASHQYELTKATFSVAFNHLRPGGLYIIEDWGWSHDRRFQEPDHAWAGNPGLSNLIFELVMLLGTTEQQIERIEISRGLCTLTKSASAVPTPSPTPFRPEDVYLTRGKTLPTI